MQDHAPAIFQRDELTHGVALRFRFVEALRPQIADGAKAYDAAGLDREKIRPIVDGVRVRAPTAFHTAHLSTADPL
ncbi:hypothetical protein V6U90_22065 [Micromonospora sp. CPCC 206060]|uniref:hypothetical protein n=1 Tax=Micromonospora sp. CPCC 206060 TaxID=3122406 RepID=UPI002FF37009